MHKPPMVLPAPDFHLFPRPAPSQPPECSPPDVHPQSGFLPAFMSHLSLSVWPTTS